VTAVPTYVAFLRAINLGPRRRFAMPDLRDCLEQAGFAEVDTWLATGNVRVRATARSTERVRSLLEAAFAERAGFEIPTVVLRPEELLEIHRAAGEVDTGAGRRYVTFLQQEPPADLAAEIGAWDAPGEGARALGRAVLWWVEHPTRAARMSNAVLERRLGVGTTRDFKVVTTLAQRWGP
jgi:uncharacterized protein (DUF1697 family)